MSPPPSGKGKESGTARVLGSGASGIAELLIFHPVDTVAKRLMSNKAKRVYKFGGQPWFNDLIVKHYKTGFTNTFGERKGKMMMQAMAGSLTGIGEVVREPEAFRGRGVVRIFLEEGTTLYRGWGWTMARNAPGSLPCLFGASAVTKEYVLGVKDYSKATWTQNFIASIAGAVASITIAAPLDTVKTRIQNANFESKVPGFTVVRELGLTPKILVVGPKLVFSYTLAQSLIPLFAKYV
ncbi:mitochondrial carrier protein [Mycena leptocephala]|nr:mitochondrial carrier protein [Mycena leptocephala]